MILSGLAESKRESGKELRDKLAVAAVWNLSL